MLNRPGFGLREQFLAFVKVLAHIAFSAGILGAGEFLRRLIGWTLTDIPNRETVDSVVHIVTLAATSLTAIGVTGMSMWVYVDDLYTDLKVRTRYNAVVRASGQLESGGHGIGGGEQR